MRRNLTSRLFSLLLACMLVAALLPLTALAEAKTFTLDVTQDLKSFAKGSKPDGDAEKAGTEGYFTIFYSEAARIDGSDKEFSDGYVASRRIHFGNGTEFGATVLNAIRIKTNSPAVVKVWWVAGDVDRQVVIFREDGTEVTRTQVDAAKNELVISELILEEAGTYYIGNAPKVNYFFRIDVTEENPAPPVERTPWDEVAAPVITGARDAGGKIEVTVKGVVGPQGGDEVVVSFHNASGGKLAERKSLLEAGEHTLQFEPWASGEFIVRAQLRRAGEEAIAAQAEQKVTYSLPLQTPQLLSATSKGGGTAELIWTAVDEAEGYEIFCDGKAVGTATDTKFTVEGLTVGQKYDFRVEVIRGKERKASQTLSATATADAKAAWGFTHYGPSTNADNNGFLGDLNEEGFVTVYSEGGKGKIVPGSVDGLAFYYTAVPVDTNFTLRAKVTVDAWEYSNGQEGFGLMVADRLGPSGDTSNFWNNQLMALSSKIEYRYDGDNERANTVDGTGTKYTMKLGLGIVAKTGVTLVNLPKFEANDTDTINKQFLSEIFTLETAAGYWEKESGTYNIIGNCTNEVSGSIDHALLTEFVLEIQKNNTGYFITYYDGDGNVLSQKKFYGTEILSQLDEEYVYAGFFAARNARATFSDVTFTTVPASQDAPAEEKPVTKIKPTAAITSATVTTKGDYELAVDANVSGTLTVTVDGQTLLEKSPVTGGIRYLTTLDLPEFGENRIKAEFCPDPDQNLGPDTVLESDKTVFLDHSVTYNKGFYHCKTLYVSPEGLPNGTGDREHPLDIYTAVDNAVPGQTIVLLEGTYKLTETLRIQRGMDGTEAAPISLIADPEAATRPVLDFQGQCAGIVHGGDYWYFRGFDVTNSGPTQKGFQVSGNYNTLEDLQAYRNGNTGIQISRYSGTDLFPDWPAHNLVLNCTSYYNSDPGEEDADGFAAKLTCGEGNVFDGCVAYCNADDGWDMYAKVETGSIGAVTVRNCVAYSNGVREDGTLGEGNGNGFKLGGDSLSGKHILENSYAFFNKAKGIDSNSCPDIIVKNCVSYNNGSYNVALYTNNGGSTDFSAEGVVSFMDGTNPYKNDKADNLKPLGDQQEGKYQNKSTYYWNGTACANSVGEKLTADMFVSLTFAEVKRNPDGTLDMQGFLELRDTAPAVGPVAAGTANREITLAPDEAHTYSDAWFLEDDMFHWRECECGHRGHYGTHEFKWVLDRPATEAETGRKHQECVTCGYQRPGLEVYFGEEVDTGEEAPAASPVIWVAAAIAVAAALGTALAAAKKKQTPQ